MLFWLHHEKQTKTKRKIKGKQWGTTELMAKFWDIFSPSYVFFQNILEYDIANANSHCLNSSLYHQSTVYTRKFMALTMENKMYNTIWTPENCGLHKRTELRLDCLNIGPFYILSSNSVAFIVLLTYFLCSGYIKHKNSKFRKFSTFMYNKLLI